MCVWGLPALADASNTKNVNQRPIPQKLKVFCPKCMWLFLFFSFFSFYFHSNVTITQSQSWPDFTVAGGKGINDLHHQTSSKGQKIKDWNNQRYLKQDFEVENVHFGFLLTIVLPLSSPTAQIFSVFLSYMEANDLNLIFWTQFSGMHHSICSMQNHTDHKQYIWRLRL